MDNTAFRRTPGHGPPRSGVVGVSGLCAALDRMWKSCVCSRISERCLCRVGSELVVFPAVDHFVDLQTHNRFLHRKQQKPSCTAISISSGTASFTNHTSPPRQRAVTMILHRMKCRARPWNHSTGSYCHTGNAVMCGGMYFGRRAHARAVRMNSRGTHGDSVMAVEREVRVCIYSVSPFGCTKN